MNAPPESWLQRGLERADDRVNAMLVKDLRMWMRGRLFMGGYFLWVAAVVVGSFFYAVYARAHEEGGLLLWTGAFAALMTVGGGVIPYLVYERFRAEWENRAIELTRLTPLTVRHIMRGKVASAWCASLLALAAAAPAAFTAFLLGGFDLQLVGMYAVVLAGTWATAPCLFLFLVSLGTKAGWRVLAVVVLGGWVAMGFGVAANLFDMADYLASDHYQRELWMVTLTVTFGACALGRFLYTLAVARLRPESEPRDVAPRAELMGLPVVGVLLTGLVFVIAVRPHRSPSPNEIVELLQIAGIVAFLAYGLGFLFLTCLDTRDRPAVRRVGGTRPPRKRLFFGPGRFRLCAFFLGGYAVLAVVYGGAFALLASRYAKDGFFEMRPIEEPGLYMAMAAPFLILAPGLGLHTWVVAPWTERHTRRFPPFVTILAVNALAVLLCVAGWVALRTGALSPNIAPVAVAFHPVGWLMYAVGMNHDDYRLIPYAVAVLVMVSLPLFRAALAALRGHGDAPTPLAGKESP